MIKYYNEIVNDKGHTYSVDMLHLNLKYKPDDLQMLMDYLNKLNIDPLCDNLELKYWQSFKMYTFRHLFNFVTSDCSFILALQFNGDDNSEKLKGYIEFNPNKCMKDKYFNQIFFVIFDLCFTSSIKRYDLAIDLPVHIDNCFIIKDKRKYQYIKNDTTTFYLGTRSHHGFVKLYEKDTVEKLNYNLTRLELTVEFGEDVHKILPQVYIRNYQTSLVLENKLTQNDKVLCDLLLSSDNMSYFFNKLNYEKRRKLTPYLDCYKWEFDEKVFRVIREDLRQFIRLKV